VGETVAPLQRVSLLAPRLPDTGDQGFPVNNTAAEARVAASASDPAWRLGIAGDVAQPLSLSLAELRALPLFEATLPIACVEGWSASRRWRGVRLADLLAKAGAPPDAQVTVHSLEDGLYASSEIDSAQASHPDTLLAHESDGEVLSLDHGFPVRLIGPNRPGVMQTKWLSQLVVHR
jgi:DMSO/TMAO reductase YedYZ molybdopterin-dependent catalytic subunit